MKPLLQDARLRELTFLAELEREAFVHLSCESLNKDPAYKSMALHLLHSGFLNGLDNVPCIPGYNVVPLADAGGRTNLQAEYERRLWKDIADAMANQSVLVQISHLGRVRRSELEQALRTGRDREPFGILLAMRHRDQAVAMALLSASPQSPVSLAYLDMNGLKAINDEFGHAAGDAAIKRYVQTIAGLLGGKAEGFRGEGGDEVVVVMRDTSVDAASDLMRAFLRRLENEPELDNGKMGTAHLTASCGIASTTDPRAEAHVLIERADSQQRRAKVESKSGARRSVLAVEGRDLETVTGAPT